MKITARLSMSASFQHEVPSLPRADSFNVLKVMMSIQDRPKVPAVAAILPISGIGIAEPCGWYHSRNRGNGSEGGSIMPRRKY
jgi:hypothetical protein